MSLDALQGQLFGRLSISTERISNLQSRIIEKTARNENTQLEQAQYNEAIKEFKLIESALSVCKDAILKWFGRLKKAGEILSA